MDLNLSPGAWPPEQVVLESFVRELSTGKCRPLLSRCSRGDGTKVDVVLKLRTSTENKEDGSRFEYAGAALAHHFAIASPRAVLVDVTSEVAQAIAASSQTVGTRLAGSLGINFATVYVPGSVTSLPEEFATPGARSCATKILAFDALLENVDRRTDKVNLLISGEQYLVIDHELAFGFVYDILQHRPWIDRLRGLLPRHPLAKGLRGKALDLGDFAAGLASLSDASLSEICDSCPFGFPVERREIVCQHLAEARRDPEPFFAALRELLK